METYYPVDPSKLSYNDEKGAVEAMVNLVKKRCGKIKARQCGRGDMQKSSPDYKKEDVCSPTVHNDCVMITSAIDAYERRDVMTIDCPGAFLRALASDPVLMRLRGPLVEALVLIDPALYREYITTDKKGEPILYVRMNKALYGLLKSSLDFYNKLRGDLEGKGFKINPYDPCVTNKMVNGKQMTVIWHVDDLKVSHVDPKENTKVADWMKGIYGEKLTIHRGNIHDYLGMDMDWSKDGQVSISMIKYLIKMLNDFIENITKSSVTPSADYLFKIREDKEVKKLPEELAIAYHHTVAQLLFLSQSRSKTNAKKRKLQQ